MFEPVWAICDKLNRIFGPSSEKPGNPREFDLEIERVLNEMEAPATFFLGGYWMQRHPEITRRLAANLPKVG